MDERTTSVPCANHSQFDGGQIEFQLKAVIHEHQLVAILNDPKSLISINLEAGGYKQEFNKLMNLLERDISPKHQ